MFDWLRSKCPVEPTEKVWIEKRMSWLVTVFGLERLVNARVVLPTPEFFPDPYAGTDEDVQRLFERVCGFMGVDPARVDLGFLYDQDPGAVGVAGLYIPGPKEQILVKDYQRKDPTALVATLAHELAHVLLLGDGRIADEAVDHEQVTDLLTVFLGLGVFGSNSVMREACETSGQWHRWSISKQGYLFEKDYGYALAVFAYLRKEIEPLWIRHLRSNVRSVCKAGLQYLNKTKDSQFHLDTEEETRSERIARLRRALQSPSIGTRVSALWDLRIDGPHANEALPDLVQSIQDNENHIRKEGAITLGLLGPAAESAVPALLDATLLEAESSIRVAMLEAIARIARGGEKVVPQVTRLLKDPNPLIRAAATKALCAFGPLAVSALVDVVPLVSDANEEVYENAIQLLGAMGSGAEPAIPALIQVIKTGDGPQRAHAVKALGDIGVASKHVLRVLEKAVAQDKNPGLRHEAIEALGKLGPAAESALASLDPLVLSEESDTTLQAAVALSKIDGRIDEALQIFQKHFPKAMFAFLREHGPPSEIEDEPYKVIVEALKDLSAPFAPPLVERLRCEEQEWEVFALWALGIMGSGAEFAKRDIQARLDSSDAQKRFLAAWAICRVAGPTDRVVSILIELLESGASIAITHSEHPDDKAVQMAAGQALRSLGLSNPRIVLDEILKFSSYSDNLARLAGYTAYDSEKFSELLEIAKLRTEPEIRQRISRALLFQKEAKEAARSKRLRTMSIPPLLEKVPIGRQYDVHDGFLIG